MVLREPATFLDTEGRAPAYTVTLVSPGIPRTKEHDALWTIHTLCSTRHRGRACHRVGFRSG
jgi:hypothetical protein